MQKSDPNSIDGNLHDGMAQGSRPYSEMPMNTYSELNQKKLVAHIDVDRDGIIQSVSENLNIWLQPLGIQNWIGKSLKSIFAAPSQHKVDLMIEHCDQQKGKINMTEFMLLGSGTHIICGSLLMVEPGKDVSDLIPFVLVNLSSSVKRFSEIQDYKILFDEVQFLSNTSYWLFSVKNKTMRWADGMFRILELPLDFDVNQIETLKNMVHPDDRERVFNSFNLNFSKKDLLETEFRLLFKSNKVKWISARLEHKYVETDDYMILGVVSDQTERRMLKRSDEFGFLDGSIYGSLFESLTDIFTVFEEVKSSDGTPIDYIYRMVNSSFERKFLISKQDILGTYLSERLPSVYQQLLPKIKIFSFSKQPFQDRIYLDQFDDFFDILIYSPGENLLAVLWRDISLMVKDDELLRESEEKYRQLFNVSGTSIFFFEQDSLRIIEVNNVAQLQFQIDSPDSQRLNFSDFWADPDVLSDAIKTKQPYLFGVVLQNFQGIAYPSDTFFSYFNWSGRKVCLASVANVSERVVHEKELTINELKYRTIYEQSPEALLLVDNYHIVDFNENALALFKMDSPNELLDKTIWGISANTQPSGENSRVFIVEQIQNAMLGATVTLDWVFQIGDNLLYTEIKMKLVENFQARMLLLDVRDVSAIRQKVQVLKNSNERYKLALEEGAIGIWDYDMESGEIYFSPEFKQFLGYDERLFPNKFDSFMQYVHPDEAHTLVEKIDAFIKTKSFSFYSEFRMQCNNGSYKWIRAKGHIKSSMEGDRSFRILGTIEDITKSKIKDQKEQLYIEKQNRVLSICLVGFWELDLRTMTFSGTPTTFELFDMVGVESANIRVIENFVHPEDREMFMNLFLSYQEIPDNQAYFRILTKSGIRFIQAKIEPSYDSQNTLVSYIGIFQDISVLRTEESYLREKESILSIIQGNTSLGIYILREEHLFFASSLVMELAGLASNTVQDDEFDHLTLYRMDQRPKVQEFFRQCTESHRHSETITVAINNVYNREKWANLEIAYIETWNTPSFMVTLVDVSEQYKKRVSLEKKNRYFESFLESSGDGVIVATSSMQIAYVNQCICDMLGYSKEDMLKKELPSFLVLSGTDADLENICMVARGNKKMPFSDYQILTKKEYLLWVSLQVTYSYFDDDTESFYLFQFRNIEDQKKLAQRMDERLCIANSIWDRSPHAIALFDPQMELAYSNKVYDSMFAIESDVQRDQLRNVILSIYPAKDSLSSDQTRSLEYNMPDGRCFYIRGTLVPYDQGTGIYVDIEDRTLSMRKELEQRENIRHYTTMYNSFPFGLMTVGSKHEIIFCNETAAAIFEKTAASLIGEKIEKLFPISFYDKIITQYNSLFSGMLDEFDVKLNPSILGTKWIHSTFSSVKDQFGDVEMCMVSVWDFTSHILSDERTQKELRSKLIRKMGESLSPSLHEHFLSMQVQMNAIKAFGSSGGKLEACLDGALEELQGLQKAMLGLEMLVGIERVVRTNNNLIKIIDIALSDELKGITVTRKYTFPQSIVYGDAKLLNYAFTCLIRYLKDQLHFTQEIILENTASFYEYDSEFDEDTIIRSGSYIQFRMSVSEWQDKKTTRDLFDPYPFDQDQDNPVNVELSMANNIIRQHKGIILAKETTEKGLAFNVYLPYVSSGSKSGNLDTEEELIHLNKGLFNVLNVDDENLSREITASLLRQLGCNVFSFGSGKAALDFYANNFSSIDLVLLDSNIPGSSGQDLLKSMKHINPSVVATLLIWNETTDEEKAHLATDFKSVINKPVSFDTLLPLVLSLHGKWESNKDL